MANGVGAICEAAGRQFDPVLQHGANYGINKRQVLHNSDPATGLGKTFQDTCMKWEMPCRLYYSDTNTNLQRRRQTHNTNTLSSHAQLNGYEAGFVWEEAGLVYCNMHASVAYEKG